MSICTDILTNSPVNTIVTEHSSSFREAYQEWIETATEDDIRKKQEDGLSIVLPTNPPIPLTASITDDQYEQLKTAVESGKTIDLSDNELDIVVQKSVDPSIYKAWQDCMRNQSFGLISYDTVMPNSGNFSVFVRYSPNDEHDEPPIISQSLFVSGATCVNPPTVGAAVPYGGLLFNFTRQLDAFGIYPAANYSLNTTKGSIEGAIPLIDTQPLPKIKQIKIATFKSQAASHPNVLGAVEDGWTLIGGGARVNYPPGQINPSPAAPANMLTNLFPKPFDLFHAASQDHIVSSVADIDLFVISIEGFENDFDVVRDSGDSAVAQHPSMILPARNGYQIIGGGVQTNASFQFLTSCAPVGNSGWAVSSKDHAGIANPASITCYSIAFKARNTNKIIPVLLNSFTTDASQRPQGRCPVTAGCKLIGGGAVVNVQDGGGVLLTASYPDGESWCARGADHTDISHASITIWAIGIPSEYFA